MCAFCGLTFTTPHHKDSVTEHVRLRHTRTRQNNPMSINKTWQYSGPSHSATKVAAPWLIGNPLRHATDLVEIGSKWPHTFHRGGQVYSHIASVDPAPLNWITQCDNPSIPHERILFILNCLDPRVDPKRANHFFNTLDLVAGNLLDRL
jgi:hypothetical protein